MGYYINPPDQTKTKWLADNNSGITWEKPRYSDLLSGHHFVVLVDNGAFSAAGIAYDEREFDAFSLPDDPRMKAWVQVPDEKLIAVCPEVARVLNAPE